MASLERLLELQKIDLEIDRLNLKVSELESHQDLKDTNSELDDAETNYRNNIKEAERLSAIHVELESQIAGLEARIEEEERSLVSKNIGPRQLQDMAQQIENHKLRLSQLQDQWLEISYEMESVNVKVSDFDTKVRALQDKKAELCASIESMLSSVKDDLYTLNGAKVEIRSALPPDLLSTYDAIRKSGHQIAVALVENSRCGSCHLNLSTIELDHLKKSEELEFCEQCGAILVC